MPNEKSKESNAYASSDIGFIYKTMLERDPKKRKVKPVEKHLELISLTADLDDSEDDSDYMPNTQVDDDDDVDDSDDDNANDEDDDSDDDGDDDDNDREKPINKKSKLSPNDKKPVLSKLSDLLTVSGHRSPHKASFSARNIILCSVCLGDVSHSEDEIVECDACGVSVHEGCYGICPDDNESVHSNTSSASTEPWFCDPCKANVKNPYCELCPNSGGIFKITDVGRYVHMVCALYTPGVAFSDVTRLSGLTLFEMAYSRWGMRSCTLCEDERLSRTGVCIGCDAGMCRSYFHVTCAQREGLLSEAHSTDEVDPFFAYCKLHADRATAKSKRRNWLALQSKSKSIAAQSLGNNQRIMMKLQRQRVKWKAMREESEAKTWVPTQKIPRLLTTSPSAVKRLIRKAELLGMSPQTHMPSHEVVDVRRKWHVPPAFSLEFISYYIDRNNRMNSMQKRSEELKLQNAQLNDSQHTIRASYDQNIQIIEKLKNEGTSLGNTARQLWSFLNDLSKYHNIQMPKILECPEPIKHEKTSSNDLSTKVAHKKASHNSEIKIVECGICHQTKDQHQMALCDSCLHHYHLYCLDPPLTRMPKKTRFGGWQCSDCTEQQETQESEDEGSNEAPVDAPRKLREHVKGPDKYEPDGSPPANLLSAVKLKKRKASYGKKKKYKKKKQKILSTVSETSETSSTRSKSISTPPPKKPLNIEEKCFKCNQMAHYRALVQCDLCGHFYHFGCLNPPVKKNPKQRGYKWYCDNCDNSDEEEEDDEDNDDNDDDDDDDSDDEDNDMNEYDE